MNPHTLVPVACSLLALAMPACSGSSSLSRQARALPSFNAGQSAFPDSIAVAEIDAASWSRMTASPLSPMCDGRPPAGGAGDAAGPQLDSALANEVSRILAEASTAELEERDRLRARPGGASIPEPAPGQVRSMSVSCVPRPAVAADGKVTYFELIYASVDHGAADPEVVVLGYSPSTGEIGAMHVRVKPGASPPPRSTFALSSVKQYGLPPTAPIVHRDGARTFHVLVPLADQRSGFYAIAPHRPDDGPDSILFGRFAVR